jgi:hypothetical protein
MKHPPPKPAACRANCPEELTLSVKPKKTKNESYRFKNQLSYSAPEFNGGRV